MGADTLDLPDATNETDGDDVMRVMMVMMGMMVEMMMRVGSNVSSCRRSTGASSRSCK